MDKLSSKITQKARALMEHRSKENGAPAWELIEIAAKATERLARAYDVDVNLALTTSYLCHIVFSKDRGGEIMKNHTALSSDESLVLLRSWGVEESLSLRMAKAIRNHHDSEINADILGEIVKQADTYKFLTSNGLFIFLASLNERGLSLQEAIEYSIYKVREKYNYVTFPEVFEDLSDDLMLIKKTLNIELG